MINYLKTNNLIVVYWDREIQNCEKSRYAVYFNGKLAGETDKTFFELCGDDEVENEVSVYLIGKSVKPKNLIGSCYVPCDRRKKNIDVTKAPYFAVGDGKKLNTIALQQALNDCSPEERVYIPCGVFLTGALDIKSDSELYIDEGGILQGSGDFSDYLPKQKARFEGIERDCYRPLIRIGKMDGHGGCTTQNVRICGKGKIVGGGEILAEKIIDFESNSFPAKNSLNDLGEYETAKTVPGRTRPFLIDVCNCENAVISGLTLQDGPAWNVHIVYSKNVIVYGCDISSKGIWNGDGIDPDSSENITIFNCRFATHDDAIALKSGKNPQGNEINRPTKNVKIFSCSGKNGIAVGSEMSGGIDGVYVWDCDFSDSYSGFWIKTTEKRGGYIKNVAVCNSKFVNIKYSGAVPFNNDGASASTLPVVERLIFKRLQLSGISTDGFGKTCAVPPIDMHGCESYKPRDCEIEDIAFIDIEKGAKIQRRSSMRIDNVESIELNGINLKI